MHKRTCAPDTMARAQNAAASSSQASSWGELLNSYRSTYGSQSYSCINSSAAGSTGEQQVRYTRSVPTVCPLAEIKHPLYSVGSAAETHQINYQDGSLQRLQFHGWGDVSLLQQDFEGQPQVTTRASAPSKPTGKRFVPAPCKQGRNGLFGLLQGTEAGGVDSWIGNPQIDPTKGKRAVSAPTGPKRSADMGQLLAQTAPGAPACDAWLGNIQIDPAKGKGHAADPASTRGRADLFAILQQQILQESSRAQQQQQQQPEAAAQTWQQTVGVSRSGSVRTGSSAIGNSISSGGGGCAVTTGISIDSSSGGGGSSGSGKAVSVRCSPADQDAWLGNRLIQPNKGKKPVESTAAEATLHAATFKDGPPADGCWCDLPPIGRRPLSPPSNARHFVTAAQTMAVEMPLPASAVLGTGKPHGKSQAASAAYIVGSNPSRIDMYSLMTFKPLTADEATRCQHTWTDAAAQQRKRHVAPSAKAAGAASWQQLLAAAPAQPVRFVPRGGIAQERGMTLDAIITARKHFKR